MMVKGKQSYNSLLTVNEVQKYDEGVWSHPTRNPYLSNISEIYNPLEVPDAGAAERVASGFATLSVGFETGISNLA